MMAKSHGRLNVTDRLVQPSKRVQLPMVSTLNYLITGNDIMHNTIAINDLLQPYRGSSDANLLLKKPVGTVRQFDEYNRATVLGFKARMVANYRAYTGAAGERTLGPTHVTTGTRYQGNFLGNEPADTHAMRPNCPPIAQWGRVTVDPETYSGQDVGLSQLAERPNTSFKIFNPASPSSVMNVTGTVGSWFPEFTVGEDDFAVTPHALVNPKGDSEPDQKVYFHFGVCPATWDTAWQGHDPPILNSVQATITVEFTFDVVFHEPRTISRSDHALSVQGFNWSEYPNVDWTLPQATTQLEAIKQQLIADGTLQSDGSWPPAGGGGA